MTQTISRRQFLRGDYHGAEVALRPPWSVNESLFVELCNSCGDCITACPTSILVKGRAGFPVVDFRKGECEFCCKCVDVCKTDAIQKKCVPGEVPWALKAVIGDSCITHQEVICRSCTEQCEVHAIKFEINVGHVARPQLEEAKCNGCGACVSICPVNAISVVAPAQ